MFLMDDIRLRGASIEFEHKYLLKFEYLWIIYYIKLNPLDNEYYILDQDNEPIHVFNDLKQLRLWLIENIDNPIDTYFK